MRAIRIKQIFNTTPWLKIPKEMLADLDTNEDFPYINTCGYEIWNFNSITPNGFENVDFLPCCVIHDFRRHSLLHLHPDDERAKLKRKYDIEFIGNLLTSMNQHNDLSDSDRTALVELCFLYFEAVLNDDIVTNASWYKKITNITGVMWRVLVFPIKATIRQIRLKFM